MEVRNPFFLKVETLESYVITQLFFLWFYDFRKWPGQGGGIKHDDTCNNITKVSNTTILQYKYVKKMSLSPLKGTSSKENNTLAHSLSQVWSITQAKTFLLPQFFLMIPKDKQQNGRTISLASSVSRYKTSHKAATVLLTHCSRCDCNTILAIRK